MNSSNDASPPPEVVARLKADVKNADGRADVVFRGELDLATVPVAEHAVARIAPDVVTLVLDLRKLSFIDSSGLKLILTTAENWQGDSDRLFVIKGSPQVERVLELTGAGARLNVVEDPSHITAA